MSDFDKIDFDDSVVDESLYEQEREFFPAIVWHGRHGSESAGWWTLDKDVSDDEPSVFWKEGAVKFGMSPNAPSVPVWMTQRLRVVILGQRRRQIITDNTGIEHYFPWFTKREARTVEGDFKMHTQVAVVLPGNATIFQIPVKGMSRSLMWENPEGPYHKSEWGRGAWPVYKEYVEKARKQTGKNLPYYGTFWVDLTPTLAADGKELGYIEVGTSGVYMTPFQAVLKTDRDEKNNLPSTRWVGQVMFEEYQRLRKEVIKPWEDEWKRAEDMPSSSPAEDDYSNVPNSAVEEDDDIPF